MQIITRNCSICGKELEITLKDDGSYEGGDYFGVIKMGSDYPVAKLEEGELMVRKITWYKYPLHTLLYLKRLLLKQYEDIEYWECDECCNEEE